MANSNIRKFLTCINGHSGGVASSTERSILGKVLHYSLFTYSSRVPICRRQKRSLLYIIEKIPGIKCLKTWIWEVSNSSFQQLHYFEKAAQVFSILFKAGKEAQKEELSSGSLGNLCPTSALTGLLVQPRLSHIRTHPQIVKLTYAHAECRYWTHHTLLKRILDKGGCSLPTSFAHVNFELKKCCSYLSLTPVVEEKDLCQVM